MSANLKFQRAYNKAIQELVDNLDPKIVDGVVFDTWEDDHLMFQYKGSVIRVDAFLGRPIRVYGMSYYTHIVPPTHIYEPDIAGQMSVALQTIKRIIDDAGDTAVTDDGSAVDDGSTVDAANSDECTQKKPESPAHTAVASVPSFDAVFETVDNDAFAPEKLPPILDWNTMNGGDDDHDDADAAADATDKDIEWTTVTRKKKQPKVEKKNWKRGQIPGAVRGKLLA